MISWDEDKRLLVLKKRNIDFRDLGKLYYLPYLEDQKNDEPEQYRIVGRVGERYLTFIVEYDEDELGELTWVVTAWESTEKEIQSYEQEISKSGEEGY